MSATEHSVLVKLMALRSEIDLLVDYQSSARNKGVLRAVSHMLDQPIRALRLMDAAPEAPTEATVTRIDR